MQNLTRFMKLTKLVSFFLAISCGTPSCYHAHASEHKENIILKDTITYWKVPTGLNFLVIGDWGRFGEFHQKDVADQMAIEAKKNNSSFILSMGDNFYNDGVISTTDPQWFYSFENIYTAYHLHVPWYTVFGNHDYRGSIQAQLDYSKISRRWRTNARYYSIEKNIPGSKDSVLFVFIDTNPFDQTLDRKQHSDLAQQDTLQQKKWLENVLNNSKAKWKIAIGHHPLFTTGVRKGTMLDVRRSYVSLFEKYKVDAYFAGHEHDLQHQKPIGHTHYFVSGAGSEKRPVTSDSTITKFAISDHGFMSVQLNRDTLFNKVINYNGNVLYQTQIVKQ